MALDSNVWAQTWAEGLPILSETPRVCGDGLNHPTDTRLSNRRSMP